MSSTLQQETTATQVEESLYLITAEQFCHLIETDFFPREARVELRDGRIYEKMAKKQPHSISWTKMTAAVVPILPDGWSFWSESTLTLGRHEAPLPNILILRGKPDDYGGRYPTAADASLVIELSDSSLWIDTGPKMVAYARAGVPVYWVVNLRENLIIVNESPIPEDGRYDRVSTYTMTDSIPFRLDGQEVAVFPAARLLPIA